MHVWRWECTYIFLIINHQHGCKKVDHPQYMWVSFMVIAQVDISLETITFPPHGIIITQDNFIASFAIMISKAMQWWEEYSQAGLSYLPYYLWNTLIWRSCIVYKISNIEYSKAGLSYLPYYLWNGWEGGKMASLVQPLLEVIPA